MKYCVLYNPLSNNGKGKEAAEHLEICLPFPCVLKDITGIHEYKTFFAELSQEAAVVICGGDGTLNRFINATKGLRIKQSLFYYPSGSGNDFARDLSVEGVLIPLENYVNNLPTVCIGAKEYRFINGVGYGIDGYCCEVGDTVRKQKPKKKINYTSIAIKGLLFHYKPTNATVIVDGKKHHYKKVWIAPTMNGRYYGGGMMPTPKQDRNNPQSKISVMIFHGCGKLRTLCIFPSLFKGEHVKHKKNVDILSGHSIAVEFNEPRTAQIDGETVLNVKKYHVKSAFQKAQDRRNRLG